MSIQAPSSNQKPSYIRSSSSSRPPITENPNYPSNNIQSSALIAPTVADHKVSEQYMKRMGMKSLGAFKNFSSKFKNAIAAPYFISQDDQEQSRIARPFTRGPQSTSLGYRVTEDDNHHNHFRQTTHNLSLSPNAPGVNQSITSDVSDAYRHDQISKFTNKSVKRAGSSSSKRQNNFLQSSVERAKRGGGGGIQNKNSRSPINNNNGGRGQQYVKKQKLDQGQQLANVEIQLKKAKGQYYQGLRQLLKMQSDFQKKYSIRAHLLNLKSVCEQSISAQEQCLQQQINKYAGVLQNIERKANSLASASKKLSNIENSKDNRKLSPSLSISSPVRAVSPQRTTSLKISQIVQGGKNLKFTHFSQTKSFLHIQRVDQALLFYIYHKYGSKPVLAKSQLTEDPVELQELVGSLQLIATESGSITVRRAEDEWDTRLKSSNPYLNRLQNNILMYTPSDSSSSSFQNIDLMINDPDIGHPPKIQNFYLEKRDHQHNLRIKYINGKTKDDSAELPTYLLDPQLHIPKSVINTARHIRKHIKKNLRVINSQSNKGQYKIVQNEDDQQHLTRFSVNYAPQILDNLQNIQIQHELSRILEFKESKLDSQSIKQIQFEQQQQQGEEDAKKRPVSKLQKTIIQITKANGKLFMNPGAILLVDGIRYFTEISVDEFKNHAWLYFMFKQEDVIDKKAGKRLVEYEEFYKAGTNFITGGEDFSLKRIKIFPQQSEILNPPLSMIYARWDNLRDLKSNSLSVLKSLEVRLLLRQFQNGEFQQEE